MFCIHLEIAVDELFPALKMCGEDVGGLMAKKSFSMRETVMYKAPSRFTDRIRPCSILWIHIQK
jgi:hypothetical protein